MDPNDPKKKLTDDEIKEAAKKARSASRPGVVAVNEAAALDRRIAEKTQGATKKHAPSELHQLESDVSSKLKNAPTSTAATPGAYDSRSGGAPPGRSGLSQFESDVAAKQRAMAPGASAMSVRDRKVEAKMAAAGGNRELKNLEATVQAKMNANSHPPLGREVGYSHERASDRQREDLSRLDERIAAKNASAAPPRSLQETENIVTKKKSNVEMHGGTAISPNEKSPPEQSPMQAKDDMGGLEARPQAMHDDVEYGEYGGPTEQGLAIAFAVEEEPEDAFIPAAIEYDPDAKPPLIKNRRFRLYAFLAIIIVLVGTISTAVGLTLAGKKMTYDISERETVGIREAIERIIGAEKLEDPNGPHAKALDWIQYHDPLQATPNDTRFIQRYVAALFYYSTSEKREWDGGCAPAVEGETDECTFRSISRLGQEPNLIPWVRWLSSRDECFWTGVQCSEDGHIRSLELSGANMTGTIPDELVHWNFLQSLTLKFNEFSGTLPKKLLELSHLVDLNLIGNQFTGTIPEEMFTSPILQRLNLGFNRLTGTISTAIGEMVDAKALYLSNNELEGTIPTEIGRLHSVIRMWLEFNNLNGTIPTEFGNLIRLEDLLLNRNILTGQLPTQLVHMTALGDLKVNDNQLTGTIPDSLYSLPYLYTVDFYRNKLSGTISTLIGGLTNLDNLRLHFNDFTGTIPSELGTLPMLDNIQVFGNRFNGTMPDNLCPAQRTELELPLIRVFVSDCLAGDDGSPPEIECPCCSNCCDREVSICKKVE